MCSSLDMWVKGPELFQHGMKRARSFGLAERAMAFENWLLGRAWQDVRDSLCHGELGAARK